MIINHDSKAYRRIWDLAANEPERELSERICKIIPKVHTDRDWVTVNIRQAMDGAIVVIHRGDYRWLERYKDLILLCPEEIAAENLTKYGTVIKLPKTLKETVKVLNDHFSHIENVDCQWK